MKFAMMGLQSEIIKLSPSSRLAMPDLHTGYLRNIFSWKILKMILNIPSLFVVIIYICLCIYCRALLRVMTKGQISCKATESGCVYMYIFMK